MWRTIFEHIKFSTYVLVSKMKQSFFCQLFIDFRSDTMQFRHLTENQIDRYYY